jgi:hypothetical protein
MYGVVHHSALGSGFTLDGSGYRRDLEPGYIKEARVHRQKGRTRTAVGLGILLIPDYPIIAAGTVIGGAIGGVPGAGIGTKVGTAIVIGTTLVGVGYLGSGYYHRRKARRIERRGSNRSARFVRRDARRRSR